MLYRVSQSFKNIINCDSTYSGDDLLPNIQLQYVRVAYLRPDSLCNSDNCACYIFYLFLDRMLTGPAIAIILRQKTDIYLTI